VFGAPPKPARKCLPYPSLQVCEAGYHRDFQLKEHFNGGSYSSAQFTGFFNLFEKLRVPRRVGASARAMAPLRSFLIFNQALV